MANKTILSRKSLRKGLAKGGVKGFLNYMNRQKEKIISKPINLISVFNPLPNQSPPKWWNHASPALLTSRASYSFPSPPSPSVFGWLLCLKYNLWWPSKATMYYICVAFCRWVCQPKYNDTVFLTRPTLPACPLSIHLLLPSKYCLIVGFNSNMAAT